jgi:hypothetical protein
MPIAAERLDQQQLNTFSQVINDDKSVKENPLTFPDDIMSGLAGNFADLYSTYLEPPAHFFYVCFLASLGTFLPLTLASELKTQPRIFIVLLGQSADEKKSTAITKTIHFFQDVTTPLKVCFGVGSAEGLQKVLKEHTRLLLVFDELKQLIGKCKIDGSILLPFINTLFESNRYEAQTKTASIYLDNVHLSLLAACTIQTYEHTWDSSFTDIGFNNRLFIVPGTGEKKHSFPEKIPELEKIILQKKLGDIIQFVGNGLEVDISQDARTLYHAWYMGLDRSIHAKRLDTYALRFMMLLAVNEMKKTIDRGIVEKVIRLMDWQLAARQLYDPIDADSQMAKMEEKIRRVLRTGEHSDRDLQKKVNAHRAGSWIYQTAIRNLSSTREIQFNKATKCWKVPSLLPSPVF